MASWTNPTDYPVSQATCVQRFDERIIDNIAFSASHIHSGAAGQGAIIGGSIGHGSCPNQCVYQYITLIPFFPATYTAANANIVDNTAINGGYHRTVNSLGASSNYSVDCNKGTWNIAVLYRQQANAGIISCCFNGASVGQIDMYNAATNNNILSATSTFSVSASGQFTLKLTAVASNVSSTGYFGYIHHIELRRTGA